MGPSNRQIHYAKPFAGPTIEPLFASVFHDGFDYRWEHVTLIHATERAAAEAEENQGSGATITEAET